VDNIPEVTPKMHTVDSTNLGTTGQRKFIPGDLSDVGEFTVAFQHDGKSVMPTVGQPYLVTITSPLKYNDSSPESHAGTAICTGVGSPTFKSGANALQMVNVSFKPDGGECYFGSAWARTAAA
jgi:hypothetical protein